MAERNLDFDKVADRKNTSCLKYDFAVKRGMPADILPLWVADMDFKTSSYIQDAVAAQAEHGIYGYTESGDSYFEAVQSWFFTHYDWKVEEKWLVKTPGVVFALAMAVQAFTQENDAVMIQQPVYYPFSGVIKDNGRRIIDNTLVQDEAGSYHMDLADFEKKIVKEKVKLFFLCNPHNPVGRAWNREELEKIGDICYRHHVLIVSDEIHADFVYNRKHQVLANLKKEYEEITITCTAPSKTFNIAGLQVSNIFIPDNQLRHRFKRQIAASGYSQLNAAGLVACEAAYRYGEEWYSGVKAYIRENISFTKKFLEERIPKVKMLEPEGTYLVWVDFRALGLSNRELEDLIIHKAGLWLDSGAIFGAAGEGFQRINVACPRVTLQTALEKIETAVNNL
ncbi:MAG: pyridoxal phosphate-dependent aminotransferase [Lachnospiraceae bacterium]|nr:pyridoxal phosphate-dependent aminotransferase [Lachnospiraceae bacterium]